MRFYYFFRENGKRNEISSRILKNNILSRSREDEKKDEKVKDSEFMRIGIATIENFLREIEDAQWAASRLRYDRKIDLDVAKSVNNAMYEIKKCMEEQKKELVEEYKSRYRS